MDIMSYIVEEGLVMIPVLFILGEIIKHTNVLDNRWIPLTLLVISLGLTPLALGGYHANTIVQAILVAGVPTFGNQMYKQLKKEE
ncbi:phage holin family protein [Allofustis seminis]|uniref:phage holin family protein n=1 Tax=Allofustis seminis TaxID=166939 RepID=UPI00039FC8C2|nr:phage holin family protein [Allofustis seminis]